MYDRGQTPIESGLELFKFSDGVFAFITALYGSWASDNRVVFRVRSDSTPELRAYEKDILCWDRLVSAQPYEIEAWLSSHPSFTLV